MVKRNTQSGFGIVGIVVVIVVLGVIGGLGWIAYNNFVQKPAAKTQSTASSNEKKPSAPVMTVNPYAGWKTAKLKYEQVAYQYPANWTVTDTSVASPKGTGCVYPGIDHVVLTSSTGSQVALLTGVQCIGGSGAKTFDSMPITALGQKLYLTLAAVNLGTSDVPANPTSACLSPTATQIGYPEGVKSRNIFINDSSNMPDNDFCYRPYAYYTNSDAPAPKLNSSEFESSPDFATAKLIFESMKYTAN